MKDMLNVMSKFLALGLPLEEVILRSTWNPAREIKQEQLGHLSVGSLADVAVLRLEKGDFGFLDMYGARMPGTQKLTCEMTLRDGRIAYELNGLARPNWDTLPKGYRATGDVRWEWNRDLGLGRQPAPSPERPRPQVMPQWTRDTAASCGLQEADARMTHGHAPFRTSSLWLRPI